MGQTQQAEDSWSGTECQSVSPVARGRKEAGEQGIPRVRWSLGEQIKRKWEEEFRDVTGCPLAGVTPAQVQFGESQTRGPF